MDLQPMRREDILYKLWLSFTVLLALVGLAIAVGVYVDAAPEPRWDGRVLVVVPGRSQPEEMDAPMAQTKFLAGEIQIASDREYFITGPDGTRMHGPASGVQAMLEHGAHLSTRLERDDQERRHNENLMTALGCLVGVPLFALAVFRWGLWLVRGRPSAATTT